MTYVSHFEEKLLMLGKLTQKKLIVVSIMTKIMDAENKFETVEKKIQ